MAGVQGHNRARGQSPKEISMKTAEQIAARKAKSKARREAKKTFIPVTDENLNRLKANFKTLMARYQDGKLSYKDAGNLFPISVRIRTANTLTKEELEAKIAKQAARLARLEAALKG